MNNLKIHYLQHVPFEGLGCIEDWITRNNHQLSCTKLYQHHKLPSLSDIDWLIIMGGPMGVYDEDKFPWLLEEKIFIKKAIDNSATVIGICLGSQLVAEALGAKVYPNHTKEIGWFPVNLTKAGRSHPLFQEFEDTFPVFHWHGDTFDLPINATHLIYSEGCMNQAFLFKKNILGLQFHLETTEKLLSEMLQNGKSELRPAQFIQTEDKINYNSHLMAENNRMMFRILERMANTI